jgi:hypothetical protein
VRPTARPAAKGGREEAPCPTTRASVRVRCCQCDPEFTGAAGLGVMVDQVLADATGGGAAGEFGGCFAVGGQQRGGGLLGAAVLLPGAGDVTDTATDTTALAAAVTNAGICSELTRRLGRHDHHQLGSHTGPDVISCVRLWRRLMVRSIGGLRKPVAFVRGVQVWRAGSWPCRLPGIGLRVPGVVERQGPTKAVFQACRVCRSLHGAGGRFADARNSRGRTEQRPEC